MQLYLGIDAGGTHTRARLVTEAGKILAVGDAGPANTPAGLPQALLSIEAAYAEALRQAGLSDKEVASIRAGMGVAGLNRRGFLDGLRSHGFPFAATAFASDAAIANLGAHAGHDGGIVIAGTGSVGFGRVGERVFTVGGYGFPVSDEGSGAELGRQAIRRALWARDGRILHGPLTRDVLERFHGSAGEIVDWTARASPADYGTFAPMVLEHATRGEPLAKIIVEDSARKLEAMIGVLQANGCSSCCLVGSVGVRLRGWLDDDIQEDLREPLGDALDGAILLARTRAVQAAQERASGAPARPHG